MNYTPLPEDDPAAFLLRISRSTPAPASGTTERSASPDDRRGVPTVTVRRRAGGPRAALRCLGVAACLIGVACGDSAGELARRILDRHRHAAKAKPLPASGVIILRLRAAGEKPEPASGRAEIAWEGERYRETVTSAGVTTVRGIQGGKAFLTDEDGVTRVGSEPMLRELVTRSYFWRRAYLFVDRQRAKLRLGPSDDQTVSVDLHPYGGNPLRLKFRRSDGSLAAADSPRLHLEFDSPSAFRDLSNPAAPVGCEIGWIGLPTGALPDPQAGGDRAEHPPSRGAPVELTLRGPVFKAKVNGREARVRLDGGWNGPLRLAPGLADKLDLRFGRDVFGRELAGGVRLEMPGITFPSVTVERSAALPEDADAEIGGTIFREAVVELDPSARVLRFHDPEKWVVPENLARIIVDDDGNRPVATLTRSAEDVRVAIGGQTGGAALLLAEESARRCGVTAAASSVAGFRWGGIELPAMSVALERERFSPGWGDDGMLGWELLQRFHFYLDMPHRWIYIYITPPPGGGRTDPTPVS